MALPFAVNCRLPRGTDYLSRQRISSGFSANSGTQFSTQQASALQQRCQRVKLQCSASADGKQNPSGHPNVKTLATKATAPSTQLTPLTLGQIPASEAKPAHDKGGIRAGGKPGDGHEESWDSWMKVRSD